MRDPNRTFRRSFGLVPDTGAHDADTGDVIVDQSEPEPPPPPDPPDSLKIARSDLVFLFDLFNWLKAKLLADFLGQPMMYRYRAMFEEGKVITALSEMGIDVSQLDRSYFNNDAVLNSKTTLLSDERALMNLLDAEEVIKSLIPKGTSVEESQKMFSIVMRLVRFIASGHLKAENLRPDKPPPMPLEGVVKDPNPF